MTVPAADLPRAPPAALHRVVTFWPLVLYGLGVIVGAGIYVAIGTVVARAGGGAPLSFLLAGVVAALTGLCYAELASRFPDAGGAAVYVARSFGSDRLARLVGLLLTAALLVSAAAITAGAVGYLALLVPVPAPLLSVALIGAFTAVAIRGVRESVGLAAAITVLEVGGLLITIAVGLLDARAVDAAGLLPASLDAWLGVAAGSFIAFFAFIGFETLVNLAEEVKDARRTVPRGMLTAIAASMALYVAVATVVVLGHRTHANPLIGLFAERGARAFAVVAFLAVANGVLVHIVMLSRLLYGMARNGQLPAALGAVHAGRRTPARATLLVGALVLVTTIAVPFEGLLAVADALTLSVFVLVALALWRIKRRTVAGPGLFVVPGWVPPAAAASGLALLAAALLA